MTDTTTPADERAAFIRFARDQAWGSHTLEVAWIAWQARAASQPAQEPVAVKEIMELADEYRAEFQGGMGGNEISKARAALESKVNAALSAPAQEPVAWRWMNGAAEHWEYIDSVADFNVMTAEGYELFPIYAHPQQGEKP